MSYTLPSQTTAPSAMTLPARVVVLAGGLSSEAEVSQQSAHAVMAALDLPVPTTLIELTDDALPAGLCAAEDIIFPVLHGGYGEGGRLQADLEATGFTYVGSDAQASARAMDKVATKAVAKASGLTVAPDMAFQAGDVDGDHLVATLGPRLVLKPRDAGSSVGLHRVADAAQLADALAQLTPGAWMAEPWLEGYDLTVGVVDDEAMAVVGIHPAGGVYDFAHKYTAGQTRYECPATLSTDLTQRLQDEAARVCAELAIRDFARVDFFHTADDQVVFLEVNTLPGLTATSLLPKSAAAAKGWDFPTLLRQMVRPAFHRFAAR